VSHDAHAASGAADDHPPLPVTAGITPGVKLLIVGGLALALLQGAFVDMSSGFGRVWPADNSAKIQLPPMSF
jgi:hypothetical protein